MKNIIILISFLSLFALAESDKFFFIDHIVNPEVRRSFKITSKDEIELDANSTYPSNAILSNDKKTLISRDPNKVFNWAVNIGECDDSSFKCLTSIDKEFDPISGKVKDKIKILKHKIKPEKNKANETELVTCEYDTKTETNLLGAFTSAFIDTSKCKVLNAKNCSEWQKYISSDKDYLQLLQISNEELNRCTDIFKKIATIQKKLNSTFVLNSENNLIDDLRSTTKKLLDVSPVKIATKKQSKEPNLPDYYEIINQTNECRRYSPVFKTSEQLKADRKELMQRILSSDPTPTVNSTKLPPDKAK